MKRWFGSVILSGFVLIASVSLACAQSVHHAAAKALVFATMQTTENGPVGYVYDELGRLIAVIGASGDAAVYNYDAVGNILSIQRYTATQASVISFSPTHGVAGASVTIYGTGFSSTPSQNTVSFNGTSATVTSSTSNQIVTSVPSGATSGPITVTSPAGSATSSASFTVQASTGAPTIMSFTPTLASAGAAVAITGTNFDTAPQNDRLILNASAVSAPSTPPPTSTTMTMTVPPATASGRISLSTPGGVTVSTGDLFVYPPTLNPAQNPVTLMERISLNSPTTVSIPNGSNGGIGLLLFDGLEGQSISVYSSGNSGGYFFSILEPNYTPLPRGALGCQANCFIDSIRLPRSGTYTVMVEDGATFTLWITTPYTAAIPTNGTGFNLNLLPGQSARLSFNGVAGQSAAVQVSNNVVNNSVSLSLLNPDGSTLDSVTAGNTSFGFTNTLAQTGPHTIVIDPGSSASGSVTVTLNLQGNGDTPVPARPAGSVLDESNSLSSNLVGLFVMNEGSGTSDTNLVDAQTASFSGSGVPAWNTADPSVVFNGGGSLNSYLNAGANLDFDQLTPNQMTIVAKVFVNSVAAAGIAEKNDGNTIDSGFDFGWDSTGALVLNVEKSSGNMRVASVPNVIVTNQWLQVAFTWDGTIGNASSAHLYLNGVEQTKASSVDGSGTIGYTHATNQPFRIGNASFDSIAGALNGKIAYFAVYRGRVLSTTELSQLDSHLPVNTLDITSSITPNSSPTTITTTTAGQNARLLFTGSPGQNASIQITGNTLGQVTVSLLTNNGTTLTSSSSSNASFSVPGQILVMPGTYAVYVHTNGTATGSIQVAVSLNNLPSRPSGAVLDTTNALSTNLVGLFLMNEGSGTSDTNLVDSGLANFSGGSAPAWNTSDPSIVFNGGSSLNSYANAGADLTFDQLTTNKMTVVARVYVTTVAAAGVCEKNDNDEISGFVFGWDSTGALRLTVVRTGADMQVSAASGTITSGRWMQVAFTWDGTVGTAATAHLFVNGVEQSKTSATDGSGTVEYSNATNKPFRIGNADFNFPGSLNGKIGYLAVYRGRILTTSEMNQLDSQLPIH
jgi:YD repeat-containing protein